MKRNKKNQLLKIIAGFSILFVLLTISYFYRIQSNPIESKVVNESIFLKPSLDPYTNFTKDESVEQFPQNYLIEDFPFQSQAPKSVWDELHDEACEEASVILINAYMRGNEISADEMDSQILKMVDWEMKNWGEHRDLTVSETLEMAKSFYDLSGKVVKNANINLLKQEIAQGNPVIVPTAGRLLGNPNFRSPGPIYHMVVAIGYDEKNIIVQDVGTRNGDHYVYNQKIFYNAWHDWNEANIELGGRDYLVFQIDN